MSGVMKIYGCLLLLLFLSCKNLFQYHPDEIRLEASEKNLNQKNMDRIHQMPVTGQFKFIVIGDSQRFYDDLEDFVISVNKRNDIAFVVLNGDITDFGQNREYKWISRILNKLITPYIGV